MPVTLNAFLLLLVTFLYMALMVPIPKCIAQLKWNHNTTSRPLSDIELFDEASRTGLGSAVLLVTEPNRLLAALGAFLTLTVAGVGPFVQQILSQEVVPRQLDGMTPTVPIFNWTSPYSGALVMATDHNPAHMDLQIDGDAFDAAFYTGLIAPGVAEFPVAPYCAAVNCIWSAYWNLVVETWRSNLTREREVYKASTNYPPVAFLDRGHLISNFFFTASDAVKNSSGVYEGQNATVLECILQLRARKVQAEYIHGEWSETQIGPSISANGLAGRACSPSRRSMAAGWLDQPYIVDPTGEFFPNASYEDPLLDLWYAGGNTSDQKTACNIMIPTTSSADVAGPALVFPALQLMNVANRMLYLFGRDTNDIDKKGGIAGTDGGKTGGILNYLVSIVSLDLRAQSSVYEAHNITFKGRLENIARSLTYTLRTSYFGNSILVPGEGYRDTVVYHVEWNWVTVPASLVLLTFVLLALTILDAFGKGLQKRTDSSLALMVFGCDENVRRTVATAGADLKAVIKVAKCHLVRLGADNVLTSVEVGGTPKKWTDSGDDGVRRSI